MPPTPLRAVLFDWDGTLLDSAETSFRVYVRLFESFGLAFDRTRFAQTYSPNWYRTYAGVGLPEASWAEADEAWVRLYAAEQTPLVPGAREAVTRLRDAGLAIALVTSGSRERVARDLARLDCDRFFATVVCSEDTTRKKPDPEPLRLALSRLGVGAPEAAYVGDSPEDVEMARAAGVFTIGIPGAFPNAAALRAAGPDRVAADLAEAVGALLG